MKVASWLLRSCRQVASLSGWSSLTYPRLPRQHLLYFARNVSQRKCSTLEIILPVACLLGTFFFACSYMQANYSRPFVSFVDLCIKIARHRCMLRCQYYNCKGFIFFITRTVLLYVWPIRTETYWRGKMIGRRLEFTLEHLIYSPCSVVNPKRFVSSFCSHITLRVSRLYVNRERARIHARAYTEDVARACRRASLSSFIGFLVFSPVVKLSCQWAEMCLAFARRFIFPLGRFQVAKQLFDSAAVYMYRRCMSRVYAFHYASVAYVKVKR